MGVAELEHVGPWTEDDFFALPENGQRHELVDGSLLMSPAPGRPHQRISSRLWRLLDAAAPPELEVQEAINVRLGSGRIVIPDLAVLTSVDSPDLVAPASEVALVVEIVSPFSGPTDQLLKPGLYAVAGIPMFVRVELDGEVCAHQLDAGVYRPVATARPGQEFRLTEPFGVSFDPAELSSPRRPRP